MKPGYKTTEFWLSFLLSLFGVYQQVHAIGPVTLATSLPSVLPVIAYAISRAWTKSGAAPPADAAPVSPNVH